MNESSINLKPFNTFGIDASAKAITTFTSTDELREILLNLDTNNILVLGGGSNVLFTKNFSGTVLLNRISGIEVVNESEKEIILRAGAGVVWHDFVMHCVNNGWGGIENLSLIPGNVGASPMQNIGAYGVEIKDVFVELEAVNVDSGEIRTFSHEECEFGYRESVFKRSLKGKYIITSVTYRLLKNPEINSSYGAINAELEQMGIAKPTIQDISKAVINIRRSKLPDPKDIGNAGSFFKNPVVERSILEEIQKSYTDVPNYPAGNNLVKLAAGWLIEKAGWKGKRIANYGVHDRQALVLVNHGGCTGEDIFNLSEAIITDIQSKFGITLEREVNII